MAVDLYEPVVLDVAKESKLSTSDVCSLALSCSSITNPILEWNVTLPDTPKPPVVSPTHPLPDSPTFKILQLSDIHIDFEYQPGAIADCDQPLCCRNSSTLKRGSNSHATAGYWGDYRNCDIPVWTVESMFEHIAMNEQFDFIYWTGDLPPHNIWNQSRNDQLEALEHLTSLFNKYFPNKIIFPTLGNHETQPCNLYPVPSSNDATPMNWLYSALAEEWTKTGLPTYLDSNIRRGAFYTIKLKENLRLISLNTNYCPRENFWLLINSTDPLGQLEWLAETLQQSEDLNEKVHIIGHIHPSECLKSWSANYYRIVDRYESTIAAQIFGHDHTDQFRLFYDLHNHTRPIAVSYLGPSVTTGFKLNPAYRVYVVDGSYKESTFQILDHYTVYLNITEANSLNTPKWHLEYSAKNAFSLDNLFPQTMNELVEKMTNDPFGDNANKLFKFYSKSADGFSECDLECRKKILCNFKQSRSDQFIKC